LPQNALPKGRFNKPVAKTDSALANPSRSTGDYDIAGSIAHAAALSRSSLVMIPEQKQIETGLRTIEEGNALS